MTVKVRFLLLILFVYSINLSAQKVPAGMEQTAEWLQTLSSVEFEGRSPGTKGGQLAENYISQQFKSLGLKLFGDNYKQSFDVCVGVELNSDSELSFDVFVPKPGVPADRIKPRKRSIDRESAWTGMGINPKDGTIEAAEIAFAGFGLSLPDDGYDDYKDIDVNGKVVIVLTEYPDAKTDYKGEVVHKEDSKFRKYGRYSYKMKTAKEKGAVGIVFVKINGDSANVLEPLDYHAWYPEAALPAIQMTRTAVSDFFPKGSALPVVEKQITDNKKPNSFDLPNVKFNLKISYNKIMNNVSNIVGFIEGSDGKLKNEYILISAHFDHIGWGGLISQAKKKRGSIHFGADDNASGVAGMLELAKRFTENKPQRSIIFAGFNAEEMGLLGAKHFAENSPVAIENIVSMINLDMIGRMKDGELLVDGVDNSDVFKSYVSKSAVEVGISIKESTETSNYSDHAPFVKKGVPAMHFFTGTHSDYHTPEDTYAKVNFGGIEKIINLADRVIREIDSNKERPKFNLR